MFEYVRDRRPLGRTRWPTHLLRVAAAAGVLGMTTPAMAVVIDFEQLASAGPHFMNVGPTYQEDGFTIRNLQVLNTLAFRTAQSGNVTAYPGSTALLNNFNGGVTELTRTDGKPFDLFSIDFSEIDRDRLGPTSVTVTGNIAAGGSVSVTLALDGVFGFETLVLPGFSALTSVTWQQVPRFHQFDNVSTEPLVPIDLVSVPLPYLWLVVLAATLGVLGSMRLSARPQR